MNIIFDGTQNDFEKNIINSGQLNITVNQLTSCSKYLMTENSISKHQSLTNKITPDKFNSFNGPNNLSVYFFEIKKNNYFIFEFGEKQPGRYILNQLAVIEAEEKK